MRHRIELLLLCGRASPLDWHSWRQLFTLIDRIDSDYVGSLGPRPLAYQDAKFEFFTRTEGDSAKATAKDVTTEVESAIRPVLTARSFTWATWQRTFSAPFTALLQPVRGSLPLELPNTNSMELFLTLARG